MVHKCRILKKNWNFEKSKILLTETLQSSLPCTQLMPFSGWQGTPSLIPKSFDTKMGDVQEVGESKRMKTESYRLSLILCSRPFFLFWNWPFFSSVHFDPSLSNLSESTFISNNVFKSSFSNESALPLE